MLLLEMTTTNLEQAQSFDSVQLVKREAVVDASRYDQQISREDVDADPLVRGMFCVSAAYVSIPRKRTDVLVPTAYIKEAGSRENVPYLFVLVHVSTAPAGAAHLSVIRCR